MLYALLGDLFVHCSHRDAAVDIRCATMTALFADELLRCSSGPSTTVVRKILVISPGSSLHARRAVLVFAKAKMRGHFPLVCLIKCPPGKPQASFQRLREISWAFVRQVAFSFPISILLTGRGDLVYDDFRPYGDSNFLQSKEALVA